jgi:hypothetical protein
MSYKQDQVLGALLYTFFNEEWIKRGTVDQPWIELNDEAAKLYAAVAHRFAQASLAIIEMACELAPSAVPTRLSAQGSQFARGGVAWLHYVRNLITNWAPGRNFTLIEILAAINEALHDPDNFPAGLSEQMEAAVDDGA